MKVSYNVNSDACSAPTGRFVKWQGQNTARSPKKVNVQTCEPTLQFIINSNDNPSTNAIAGGGPADGAGLRPLQGGEGEDLLLQRHQVLQSKDLTCL